MAAAGPGLPFAKEALATTTTTAAEEEDEEEEEEQQQQQQQQQQATTATRSLSTSPLEGFGSSGTDLNKSGCKYALCVSRW